MGDLTTASLRLCSGLCVLLLALTSMGCGSRTERDASRLPLQPEPVPQEPEEVDTAWCDTFPATWAKRYGDESSQAALNVGTDEIGNVYFVGSSATAMAIDVGAAAQPAGMFLTKLGPSGSYLWSRTVAADLWVKDRGATALAVADDGNAVIAVMAGGASPLRVAKLDSSGQLLWERSFDAEWFTSFNVITAGLASDGAVFLAGGFGEIGFGDEPEWGAFVAKLDASGNVEWHHHIQASGHPSARIVPRSATVSSAGEFWVVGEFDGSVDFGAGTLTSPWFCSQDLCQPRTDVFIAIYQPSGQLRLSKTLSGSAHNYVRDIAPMGDGSVITGNTTFGIAGLELSPHQAFVATLDADANPLLAWSLEATYGNAVVVDRERRVLIAANLIGLAADTYSQCSAWPAVFRYSATGELDRCTSLGSSGPCTMPADLAVGPTGATTVVGYFDMTFDIGAMTLEHAGRTDIYPPLDGFIIQLEGD
jgi:hypothetical protein